MSNDKSATENIIAPAIGRGLSAIAQRRTQAVAAKVAPTIAVNSDQEIASVACARSSACAM